ncbi:MAG TPA: glycosyltransferase family 2 protein [Thermoanaerobaculia bacterium]|nr:glycosyltransferase family 2 protein [Thermoanaerobaculia bacterium]
MRISAVIPTLGRSPLLVPCLEALRRDGGAEMEIVVVDQGETPVALPAGLADRVVRLGENRGFTGGTNAGIAGISCELVATINDDLLIEPGWTAALVAALEREPRAAAAQGVNLVLEPPGRPERTDGWGLGWNRAFQAVQLGHGKPPPSLAEPVREVFGVSATAALYRREALAAVAFPGGQVFDERLGSYYEDADLASRLRAAGWIALSVPAARARHAGSATSGADRARARARWASLYGNRYLVLARLLGTGFWPRLPLLAMRDLKDLARAVFQGDRSLVEGIFAGWTRALRLLPAFARRGRSSAPDLVYTSVDTKIVAR